MATGGHAHLDATTGLLLSAEGAAYSVGVPYVFGIAGVVVGAVTRYMMPGMGAMSITEVRFELPRAGFLRNLRCRAPVGPGSAITDTVTVRVNTTNTALTTTLTGTGEQSGTDLTHAVAVAAGDRLSVAVTTNVLSTMTDMTATLEWTPT